MSWCSVSSVTAWQVLRLVLLCISAVSLPIATGVPEASTTSPFGGACQLARVNSLAGRCRPMETCTSPSENAGGGGGHAQCTGVDSKSSAARVGSLGSWWPCF